MPSIPRSTLNHLQSISPLSPRAPTPSPTSTTADSLSRLTRTLSSLAKRQTIVAIPTTYKDLNTGPAPGVVAGIVLGSVAAVLLVLWLIYTCFNLGGGGGVTRNVEVEEVVRTRSHRSRSPRRVRSRSRSEVIEVRSPPRRERERRERSSRRETIVIEESRRREPERVEESVLGDDIVEVIEEHSPAPRRERRERRVSSGYRAVDPEQFGGGDRPRRKVSRH
ncbi:MAG: hypothetical protein MMC23_009684 [Stictis urceolatum]|nr:hypothetical protein [Stictis urceolata]